MLTTRLCTTRRTSRCQSQCFESSCLSHSQDCGYYYDEFDLPTAVKQLKRAILEHDSNMEEYNKKADECIWRFHVDNPVNIATYDSLLDDLMAVPLHKFVPDDIGVLNRGW